MEQNLTLQQLEARAEFLCNQTAGVNPLGNLHIGLEPSREGQDLFQSQNLIQSIDMHKSWLKA